MRGLEVRRESEAQKPHLVAAVIDAVGEVEQKRGLAGDRIDALDAARLLRDVPVAIAVLIRTSHALEGEVLEDALELDLGQAGHGLGGRRLADAAGVAMADVLVTSGPEAVTATRGVGGGGREPSKGCPASSSPPQATASTIASDGAPENEDRLHSIHRISPRGSDETLLASRHAEAARLRLRSAGAPASSP